MFRTPLLTVTALALVAAGAGCQKQATGGADPTKVAELNKRIETLDARLAKIEELLGPYLNKPPEPDPKATYSVAIGPTDPIEGPADAKVTIVEGFEFACPYCYRASPTVKQVLQTYPNDVRVVSKYYVVHDVAVAAGLAACAANIQGKYAAMKELIWEKGFKAQQLSPEHLEGLAGEAGLDVAKFKTDVASDGCKKWLADSQEQLSRVGTTGTPAFYINGRFLNGAQPFEEFKKLIDEELAKADKAIAGGIAKDKYYQVAVVDKGLKELAAPEKK
jgi:protein-disulfide isomerase